MWYVQKMMCINELLWQFWHKAIWHTFICLTCVRKPYKTRHYLTLIHDQEEVLEFSNFDSCEPVDYEVTAQYIDDVASETESGFITFILQKPSDYRYQHWNCGV